MTLKQQKGKKQSKNHPNHPWKRMHNERCGSGSWKVGLPSWSRPKYDLIEELEMELEMESELNNDNN